MTRNPTAVRLEKVSKTWPDGRTAVTNLDWSWRPGAMTVLVGASGSGKTTTLRLVAGLEQPTTGKISFDGLDQARFSPHERQVALVHQSPGLFPQWTVKQNMEVGKACVATGVIANFLEIEELLHRYPGEISGGEQQRVALGRAMLGSKKLLLMDEPLGQLDGWLRHELRRKLRAMQRQAGVTTLVVTHDPDEAFALADDLAVMDAGRLLQVGTPADIYDRPADLTVARLFGRGGMNLWLGQSDGKVWHVAPQREGSGWRLDSNVRLPGVMGKVWLGVRAEDLRLDEPHGRLVDFGRGVVTKGEEYFGTRRLVPVEMMPGKLLVRMEVEASVRMSVGDEVKLAVNPERLHWFSGTSGKRIEKLEQFEQSD